MLLNAIYYSPNKGTLEIINSQENNYMIISISDSGPGIKKNDQGKIFQPFYTTKISGSGLGLSIVYNIIKAHKGTIEFYNRSPQGACFEIHLPIESE